MREATRSRNGKDGNDTVTIGDAVFAWLGAGALLAAVLPRVVSGRRPLSLPMVFMACGIGVYLLPLPLPVIDPVDDRLLAEHATEVCVIISLMGAGLALNRPVGRHRWAATWRLLGITMPLTFVITALVAWWLLDWPPAAALLLAAVLAPTDPVLASEVQVGEPTEDEHDEDEVRFALTSEAGLNDGLAFPLTYAAVALAAAGGTWSADRFGSWALEDLAYKCVVGVLSGLLVGRLLGWLFFRTRSSVLRLSRHREGFVALGATFLSYGLTELVGGYGFLAVFTTACAIRAAERAHGYHNVLHDFVEQVERLFTAVLLFLLGAFVALGGLAALTWQGIVTALAVLLVIRPLSGWTGLLGSRMDTRERWVVAGYGIRGIGSLYYLAYGLGQEDFPVSERELWAVVAFTVLASVVLHGVTAGPVIDRLDRLRDAAVDPVLLRGHRPWSGAVGRGARPRGGGDGGGDGGGGGARDQ